MGNNLKTYNYTVDQSGGLVTVQKALDRLTAELQGEPIITKDVVITVGSGVFPGFKLEKGTLMPFLGSKFQVIIRANGGFFPIFDGNHSPRGIHIGADIESANPNLQIEGLRFQNFSVGIRYGLNSHNPIVRDCILTDNTNVGIMIEQCSNTIVSTNVVVNGDFGIVTRLCNNISLLHNTVLMNGLVGQGEGAIWAQLANDYGGGATDTGKLHILGNIAWNMTSNPTVILFKEDLEDQLVISNFNDFVRSGDTLISIEKKNSIPNIPREPHKVFGLSEWKKLGFRNPDNTPLDGKSISQDPKFLQSIKSRGKTNGLYIDLSLLPISPVLGIVPSFHFDSTQATAWLPSYVDAVDLLGRDILDSARLTAGTAAGANEKRSNSGYFGQDVFITPRDLNPKKDCDVDPLRDLIYKKLDLWFPRLLVGYFNSHEREYYLYAQKHCRYLGECAVTEFRLPDRVVPNRPIKVSVAGENVKDPRYIDLRGDVVVLYHFDLDIQDGTEEFEIQCWIRQWNDDLLVDDDGVSISDTGFTYSPVHYRFKINEGTTRFLIPPDYVSEGPVILTDDGSALPDSPNLANREFQIEWDAEEQRAEIILANNSNLLLNSQFDKILGDTVADPYGWSASGAICQEGRFFSGFQTVMGNNACRVEPSGYVSQIVPITSGNFCFSWHSLATPVSGHEVVTVGKTGMSYSVTLYDANYDTIGITFSGGFSTTGMWTRNYLTFGKEDPNVDQTIRVDYDLVNVANLSNVPELAAYADIALYNETSELLTTARDLWLDAAQYEEAIRPTMYHRKPQMQEITVEYETSDDGYFTDTRQALAPVRNKLSQGFLYIPEIPASMYGGPNNTFITTLCEKGWPLGRKEILPWGRITGKDKLRHKDIFNTVPEPPKPRILLSHQTFVPSHTVVTPGQILARQDDKNGVGLEVTVVNEEGNPYSLGRYYIKIKDPLGRFPGWLHKKFLGANQRLGIDIHGTLDNAGSTQLLWIPPDSRSIRFVGEVPRRPQGTEGDVISSIDTNYRVNAEFHGNPIILNDEFNVISGKASTTNRNIYRPSYARNQAIVRVKYPLTPGTVRVQVDGEILTETFVDSPNSDQFYVDYQNSQVLLQGRPETVDLEYLPSYVFISPADPYNICFFHDQVFGNYVGPITVGYDAEIDLDIYIGFATTNDYNLERETLIAQNYLTATTQNINTLSAEY